MAPRAACLLAQSRCIAIVVVLLSVFRQSTACESDEFTCNNGGCVSYDLVCNYFDNCIDNSDEKNCTYPPADMTKALVCIMNSRSRKKSFVLTLFGNPDRYAYLMGDDTYARRLPIHMNWIHFEGYDFLHTMSIDYNTHKVYCSNNLDGRLEYGYFIYHNDTYTYFFDFVPDTKQINGVAVDWMTKNFYWTDGLYKVIGVVPLAVSTRVWKAIIDSKLSSPQDIVVNPVLRYLFWSDGTHGSAKIERSDLSGNNRTVLVSSAQGLASPTTLVIDFSSQKLYWLDSAAQKIGRVNFDGSELFTQIISSLSHVSAMTVYRDYIYFGNNQTPEIYIYDKTNMRHISSYQLRDSGGITDLAMFASDVQPSAPNPCEKNNGNCNQFCWTLSSNTSVCDCALGFFLASDGTTCTPRPLLVNAQYLLVADSNQRNVYQLQLDSGEVRALPMIQCKPITLTFDPFINGIYVICDDTYRYRIHKKTFDGKIDSIIYIAPRTWSESQLVGLALDAKRELLYYTDKIQGIIAEITTNGLNRREIFSDGRKHPRALVVDSNTRRLYWSDCSGSAPTIQTARVEDGGDLRTLITDKDHACIVDIVIDFDNNLMYWVSIQEPAVKMAFLNGTRQITLRKESEADYTGITLYNKCLYISDSSRRNIIKFDLSTHEMSLQAPGLFTGAQDVKYCSMSTVTVTSSPSVSPTSSPPGDDKWMMIMISVAGVGGFLVLGVVVIVIVQVAVLCHKRRRPVVSTSSSEIDVVTVEPVPAPLMSCEVQGAVGGVNVSGVNLGSYESLRQSGNIYNTLDEAPCLPTTKRPVPPAKPILRSSLDDEGYLKVAELKKANESKL